MQIISEIQANLTIFNKQNNLNLAIDTINANIIKSNISQNKTKLEQLHEVATKNGLKWQKLNAKSLFYNEFKKHLNKLTINNAYKLSNESVYLANRTNHKDKTTNRYKTALLVIYGLKQYHKPPTSQKLINELLKCSNGIKSLDICFDSSKPFNIKALKQHYKTSDYKSTIYLNNLKSYDFANIDKVCVYDKRAKNELNKTLYRAEATISLPNLKEKSQITKKERLELVFLKALEDFKIIIDTLQTTQKNQTKKG